MFKTKRTVSVLLPLSLAGCIAPGTNIMNVELPRVEDKSQIPAETCFIATRISVREAGLPNGDSVVLRIRHSGVAGSFYNAGTFILPRGSTFRLAAFKPGKYVWSEVQLGRYSGVFKEEFSFDCIDKKVTYIGDVDLHVDWSAYKYVIRFVDRHGRAADDYAAEYPLLAANYPLVPNVTDDPRRSLSQDVK